MFNNWINSIRNWFSDWSDRNRLVRDFNNAGKAAYINKLVPTYLQASISRGDSSYSHQHSHWLYSGFRISVFNGMNLDKEQLLNVAHAVLSDQSLVRKMVVLGFDTLEVHGQHDTYGLKFKLSDNLLLGF